MKLKHNPDTNVENSRTITVYYNFVRVGNAGAFSHQETTGEYDADNKTIIIKGKSCDVEECSYYRMRRQGLEVDDPRADFQYQAFCASLTGNYAYFN